MYSKFVDGLARAISGTLNKAILSLERRCLGRTFTAFLPADISSLLQRVIAEVALHCASTRNNLWLGFALGLVGLRVTGRLLDHHR